MLSMLVIRKFVRRTTKLWLLNGYKKLESMVMFSAVFRYSIQQYLAVSITAFISLNKLILAIPDEVEKNEGRKLNAD